jgi:hypothetical protein
MNWKEWEGEYPPRKVESLPSLVDGPFHERWEAETVKENLELSNECGGFEVVTYHDQLYIVSKDST